MTPHTTAIEKASLLGAVIERATVYPWIVEICWSREDGIGYRTLKVIEAPLSMPPEADVPLIPPDVRVLRADIFPATRFDDMRHSTRLRYAEHYRALMAWRQPWLDSTGLQCAALRWICDARA